jgi:hypothetical protein
MDDADLIKAFVESFSKLDDCMFFTHEESCPAELNASIDPDDWNHIRWRPAMVSTDPVHLRDFRWKLGNRLPRLYEQLIVSYRWLEVSLDKIRLLANPPGPSLEDLRRNITRDPVFESLLISNGYVPFARDINIYDPVCFDLNRVSSRLDCPMMRFEHEALLSFDKIGGSWVLWPSVEAMMLDTIEAANRRN